MGGLWSDLFARCVAFLQLHEEPADEGLTRHVDRAELGAVRAHNPQVLVYRMDKASLQVWGS